MASVRRRSTKIQRRLAVAHVIGLAAGGATTAVFLGLVGRSASGIPEAVRNTALLVIALTLLAHALGLVNVPLPQNQRQIPAEVFHPGRLPRAFAEFGFELGTGVRTYVPSASPYLVAAAVVLLDLALPITVLAGVSFGLGRAAYTLLQLRKTADHDAREERWAATFSMLVTAIPVATGLSLAWLAWVI